MLIYFHITIEKLNLHGQLLLVLGMDGPNVNKYFQKNFGEELELKGKKG